MKKFMVLAVVALASVAMISCGGNKKENKKENEKAKVECTKECSTCPEAATCPNAKVETKECPQTCCSETPTVEAPAVEVPAE